MGVIIDFVHGIALSDVVMQVSGVPNLYKLSIHHTACSMGEHSTQFSVYNWKPG